MSTRITAYWSKWRDLTTIYGDMCFYCRMEAATTIDHVLPYSYAVNNELYNLRPACALCNCIAGDKIFETVEDKCAYILDRLKHRKDLRHAFCTECGIAFIYREQSPSLFLCPECYDLDQGKAFYSLTRMWRDWLRLHVKAGWSPDVYRRAGKMYRSNGRGSHKFLVQCLIQSLREEEARQLSPLTLNIMDT